jgi:hypothetical protein
MLTMTISESLSSMLAWVQAHPQVTIATLLYIIVNVMPRKDHSQMAGWQARFWEILDRASFLTRERVPGRLKMLFSSSPLQEEDPSPSQEEDEDISVDIEEEKGKD